MKVLMFGWEFPPHISGGLGTACAGLTHALAEENVDVLFTVPKLHGDEKSASATFISASSVPITQKRSVVSEAAAVAGTSGEESALKANAASRKGQQTILEAPVYLSPYSSSEELSLPVQRWNYSFHSKDERTLPASIRRLAGPAYAGDEEEATVTAPYPFSGTYYNVLEEVAHYTSAGAEIARSHNFDVIHAHDWMTYPAALAAKKVSGKPLIVHVHATEVDRSGTNGNPEIFEIERKGMQEADRVVTVSLWTKQVAIAHYHIDGSKIEVVHNGVAHTIAANEKTFSPPVGSQIVTFLGRITHQKGPLFFVEAASMVHNKFPDAHFVVAGSGDQLPQMIERIAQLRLSSHFHFTGFLQGPEIDRIWSISNVYVMPSVSEPFGLATLEAIQAGVPVILSKQTGVSEVVPDAIKVDFWNCEALAEAICNVLRFKSLANTLRKNGAEEIKNITWNKAAKKITRLYYEVTSNHHPAKKPDLIFSGTSTQTAGYTAVL